MKKNKNKINLAITMMGLLGVFVGADAQVSSSSNGSFSAASLNADLDAKSANKNVVKSAKGEFLKKDYKLNSLDKPITPSVAVVAPSVVVSGTKTAPNNNNGSFSAASLNAELDANKGKTVTSVGSVGSVGSVASSNKATSGNGSFNAASLNAELDANAGKNVSNVPSSTKAPSGNGSFSAASLNAELDGDKGKTASSVPSVASSTKSSSGDGDYSAASLNADLNSSGTNNSTTVNKDVVAVERKESVKEKEKFPKIELEKIFAERQKYIDKYGKGSGLILGVYPGSTGYTDTISHTVSYLPLANFLTIQSNELVSFALESNVKRFKERAALADFDMLYVNSDIAISAWRSGYDPILKRTEKIVSVVFTKKDSPVLKIKDLNGLKLGEIPGSLTATLALAKFKKENVTPKIISGGRSGQKGLVIGLDTGAFDAIVMREENAKDLMLKEANKYKIAIVLDESPGYILLASKDLPSDARDHIIKSMTAINQAKNPVEFVTFLDNKPGGFVPIDTKELEDLEVKIKSVE